MEEIQNILEELQQLLASADLKVRKKRKDFRIELARKLNMKFRMEPDQHHRAHVHIQYGKENHKASYAVDNGELLAGSLPTYQEKVVVKWISDHSETLDRLWVTLKRGEDHSPLIRELHNEEN
jgi:hypothetical protein